MSAMEDQVLVLGSSKDGNVYVVDPSCSSQLFVFKGSSVTRHGLCVVPRTGHLIGAQPGKLALHMHLWGKDVPTYKCHVTEPMGPLIATRDGNFCLAGGASGKIYVWCVATGALLHVWDAHYKAVSALSLTPDNAFLVSGGEDAVVHVWRLLDILDASNQSSALNQGLSPLHTWTDHVLPITHIHCGFGGRVFTSSLDRTTKIWDLFTGHSMVSITCPSYVNVCVPDAMEHRLFLGAGDGRIYVVDLHAAATAATAAQAQIVSAQEGTPFSQESLSTEGFVGHEHPITNLVVSLCGRFVISGDDDGAVRVWDSVSRQALRTMNFVKGSISAMVLLPRPAGLFHPVPKNNYELPIAPFKKYIASS
ncbi:WD domain-containing protein [Thraustotheca clavata]|uniref:WD domain-containing protein n=1 Tax=Thraustotheca clavata TaxID=74557 RepID=A0A1V9ZVM6_9STRA|nr:WD domain-containing protein [Thraustotheca clavata]